MDVMQINYDEAHFNVFKVVFLFLGIRSGKEEGGNLNRSRCSSLESDIWQADGQMAGVWTGDGRLQINIQTDEGRLTS